jgi:hypothetical protein
MFEKIVFAISLPAVVLSETLLLMALAELTRPLRKKTQSVVFKPWPPLGFVHSERDRRGDIHAISEVLSNGSLLRDSFPSIPNQQ